MAAVLCWSLKKQRTPGYLNFNRRTVRLRRKWCVPGTDLGKHCSITEWRAEKAERELIRIKMLRYMAERIGEEMDSIITGVESFGMFCQT